MIQAVIHYHDDVIDSFKITGHADSGPYGQDIVCAAVSVLSITTVNSLTQIAEVEPDIEQNENDGGYLMVKIPSSNNSENQLKSQTLLLNLQNGLKDVAENYAKFLKLTITH